MTEAQDDARAGQSEQEPVGSLAEEAAKLFEVLKEQSHQQGVGPGGFAEGASAVWRDLNEHLATGENCRYCPVCRVIAVTRQPEVRQHLASAASSLAAALTSALATRAPEDHDRGSQAPNDGEG